MMRFLHKFSDLFLKHRHFGRSILRASLFSTQAELSSSPTLYEKLQRCYQQRVSVIPLLDEWVVENGQIQDQELKRLIANFRKNHRFRPALEIAEWMSDKEHFAITPKHVAVQLDLISKVHGVEQAENYFNGLDNSLIDLPVYGALLNCYVEAESLEKAKAIMEKIRNMKCCGKLDYNKMLSLYSKLGMPEKLDLVVQEMENKGIGYGTHTYNIMLNAYAGSDMEAMEKLLRKMEVDPLVTVDFCSYATEAKGYIRAGALEKASVVLKKAEHLMKAKQRRHAYGILITYYAAMRRKEDVYRIWNLLQDSGKLDIGFYASMINSLEKLDDLDGAKRFLEEWEKKTTNFDIRFPNLVICAYCEKGQVEEAEIILNRLTETGKQPTASTWDRMAHGSYKNGQMEKAIQMLKKAFLTSFPSWKPNLTTIAACLEHLKNKGDTNETQEFLMLLEKCGNFSVDFKERVRRYLNNAKPSPEALESQDEIALDTICLCK